jgi:hypothetical protein
VLNKQSIQAAERLGFTFEGVHRNAIINKGRNRDTAWFSIIQEEFQELDALYTHWLSHCLNVDTGQQTTSLRKLTMGFLKQKFPSLSISFW